jgi:hypothetical protein
MIRTLASIALVILTLCSSAPMAAQAEPHRATRLGNPATRFADPLKTPEDLRRTLLSEALRDDVVKVLRLSGYNGDIEDFRRAAGNAPIRELRIPVGSVLPAMSTRVKGKVDLLRNVLWAGKKPIDAYEFSFISGERRYRVVTPKACSNFWVEEQLPRPRHELALSCEAPGASTQPHLLGVCCTLRNSGDLAEPQAVLTLPMPAGARVRCVSGGADTSDATRLSWKFDDFAPGAKRTVCATFAPEQPGRVVFEGSATGKRAAGVSSQSETRVAAMPAELLEVVAETDPVKAGGEAAYLVRVRNPGAQPLTNVRIVARLADGQRYIGGSGPTPVTTADDGRILPAAVARLAPGEQLEWRIVAKADTAGEVRLHVALEADEFFCPVEKTRAVARD